ncbi:MAG: site-2 protease family protein [Myxococcota bacterium]
MLDAAPGAGVWLGFVPGVGRAGVEAALDRQADLTHLLRFVPVQPGDELAIPAGTVHAIGPGVTLLEAQLVRPGKSGITYRFWDWNRGRPLHRERALAVADFEAPVGTERKVVMAGLVVEHVTGWGPVVLPARPVLQALVALRPLTVAGVVLEAGQTAALPAGLGPVALDLGAGRRRLAGEGRVTSRRELREVRLAKLMMVAWPLGLAVSLGLVATRPEKTAGWVGLNLTTFIAFSSLSLVPHELGHALAGRLVGLRIHVIHLGVGRTLGALRLGPLPVVVHAIPFGGLTQASHRDARGFKARRLAFILGGPLANLLVFFIAWAALPPASTIDARHGYYPLLGLAGASLLYVVVNLWPHVSHSVFGPLPSDGAVVLGLRRVTAADIERQLAAHYVLLAQAAEATDLAQARALVERGLEAHPTSAHLIHERARILLAQGDVEGARHGFLAATSAPSIDTTLRPLALGNLALTDVRLGRDDLKEEADRVSRAAIAGRAASPHTQVVRGIVLAWCGEVEAGRALVAAALPRLESPAARRELAATLERVAPR